MSFVLLILYFKGQFISHPFSPYDATASS